MKNTLYALLLLLVLFGVSSCDRFEHDFVASQQVDFSTELFTPLQADFDASTAADLSPAMAHYADDYQHYGTTKSEWQTMLEDMLAGVADPQFTVTFSNVQQQNETEALANWRLTITNPATRTVIADSLYTAERLRKVGDKWLLRGNQNTCNPVRKQLVIAEYFTYNSCSYCPPFEVKLHELEAQYPGQFISLEHHTQNALHLPEDVVNTYYGVYSAPGAVFQGTRKVTGSSDVSLALYQSHTDELVQIDEPIRYQMLSANVAGREISASVKLTPHLTLDQSNMVLNYVVIEETSSVNNAAGVPLHNVVRALGSQSLSGVDLNQPVAISFSSTVDLPEDIKLVVFAQSKPTPFANNATIYGGAVHTLARQGR